MLKPFCLLSIILLQSMVAGASASPESFAYQSELSGSNQSLQRVEIPIEALLSVTREDLGDISIFDSKGIRQPGLVRRQPRIENQQQIELAFHIFNSLYKENSKTVTTREQTTSADQVSEIQITETLSVDQSRPVYIIEFPENDRDNAFTSISLQWSHEPANQMLQLNVDISNNLDDWQRILSNKNLSNQDSEKDEWQTIRSIPNSKKYLRLTPVGSVEFFELKKVTGHYYRSTPEPRLWHRLEPMRELEDQPGFYAFELPGAVKPAQLRMIPATEQSLIGGAIYASNSDFEHKRRIRGKFQQHNITGEEIKPSKALKISRKGYRYWWFKPDRDVAVRPHIEISYPVYEFLFLGNGSPPYRLSWGNFEAGPPDNDLANLLTDAQKKVQPQLVKPGRTITVGGEDRLAAPQKLPWLKWLLWLLMLVAVVVTAKMVLSLLQDMKTGKVEPKTEDSN